MLCCCSLPQIKSERFIVEGNNSLTILKYEALCSNFVSILFTKDVVFNTRFIVVNSDFEFQIQRRKAFNRIFIQFKLPHNDDFFICFLNTIVKKLF